MKIEQIEEKISDLITLAEKVLNSTQNTKWGTYVEAEISIEFESSSLSFLKSVFGSEHPYYTQFLTLGRISNPNDIKRARGVLYSAKNDIESGWLFNLKEMVAAEIFSDFMEMAEYLMNAGYKDPAAVVIGSVLEEHLRQLCIKKGIEIEIEKGGKLITKKADQLNSDLVKGEVYNKLDQKSVVSWLDLRNKAAHGKFNEYSKEQVRIMYQAVLDFMTRTLQV